MSRLNQQAAGTYGGTRVDGQLYDEGLRQYMLGIYNYMVMALALTGIAAFAVAEIEPLRALFFNEVATPAGTRYSANMLGFIAMLAPIGLVFFLSFRAHALSVQTSQMIFWIYATLMGIAVASALLTYTGESVARVFFITAAAFGALSLWGYTTKRDLSGWGSFLFMGVIGLIIASVVNMFLGSSALMWAISVAGVGIFAGLTAYDTQKLKEIYLSGISGEAAQKTSIMGALTLYLDFINMFFFLLSLMGDRE